MKYKLIVLASVLALATMSTVATADDDFMGSLKGDWEFTLGGSGVSDNDGDNGTGGLEASLGYLLTDNVQFTLRQSAVYSDFGDSAWNGSTRGAIDLLFRIGEVRPYIGANLGYVYGDSVEETFAAAPEAGIKWWVTESAFLYGQVEYQFFFEDSDDADDAFDDGSFVYSVGIGFHF